MSKRVFTDGRIVVAKIVNPTHIRADGVSVDLITLDTNWQGHLEVRV